MTTKTNRALFVEERKNDFSENRDPTSSERAESEALRVKIEAARAAVAAAEAELKTLLVTCEHKVSYDVAGIPYDARYCNACNKSQGLV